MHVRRLIPLLLCFGAMGCSYDTAGTFSDDSGAAADTGMLDDTSVDAPGDEASWLALSGTWTIAAGALSTEESSLLFTLYDTKLAMQCSDTSQITATTEWIPPTEELTLVAGYTFELGPFDSSDTCVSDPPALLAIGVGALDEQLTPAMTQAGIDPLNASLYGLYVRLAWSEDEIDTAPTWVYGVAGTTDQYEGAAEAASESPLPDGVYELQPLHLLPTR